jgi:hypothetical protein
VAAAARNKASKSIYTFFNYNIGFWFLFTNFIVLPRGLWLLNEAAATAAMAEASITTILLVHKDMIRL